MKRRKSILAALLLCLCGATFAMWMMSTKPSSEVTIAVSACTAGRLDPCGSCSQSGGMPRRATAVTGLREKGPVVVLDAGGAVERTSPYDLLKLKYILLGERLLGTKAHNLGAAEVAFSAAELREVAKAAGATFVSANVHASPEVAKPSVLIDTAPGKVGVTGVVIGPGPYGEGLTASDPEQALLNVVPELRKRSGLVVILVHGEAERLDQLARKFPEADLVAGGVEGQPIAPHSAGKAVVISGGAKGKFLSRVSFRISRGGPSTWEGANLELGDGLADDASQVENLRAYRTSLAEQRFTPFDTALPIKVTADAVGGNRLAGAQKCAECHEAEFETWKDSSHARAFDSLRSRGSQNDPSCQVCHTTGYGWPDGFLGPARTPNRVAVGCESCHGPGARHAVRSKERRHDPPFAARNSCLDCHDRENSPSFDFGTYWPRIRHGSKPKRGGPTREDEG